MRREHLLGLLYLNSATLLWGTTFVVIKQSLASLSASQVTLARFAVAALCFLPFVLRLERKVWLAGLELGCYLWLGYATQAVGLEHTTASRSAFITTLYVVLLPIFLGLIGHRLHLPVWAAALMAIAGVGLLSYDGSPPNVGDLWTLGTALACTFWRLEHFVAVRSYPTLPITGAQMFGVALLSGVWVAWERPAWDWATLPCAEMLASSPPPSAPGCRPWANGPSPLPKPPSPSPSSPSTPPSSPTSCWANAWACGGWREEL